MMKPLAALALIALIRGCGSPDAELPPSAPEEIYNGANACRHTTGTGVARSEKEMRQLWHDATCSEEDIPQLDFSKEMAVAYFMGEKPTTGFRAVIERVEEQSDALLLRVVHEVPGDGCLVGQAVTHPVVVVKLPRRDGVSIAASMPTARKKDCQ